MTSRRRRRKARTPRPIIMTREAAQAMYHYDTHHFTDLRVDPDTVDEVVRGEAVLGDRVIRGRRIA